MNVLGSIEKLNPFIAGIGPIGVCFFIGCYLVSAFDEIKNINRKIIYGSISGFGQTGPYSKRPGSDTVLQSFSGLAYVNKGNDGIPHRVGMLVPDTVTGVYAHQAVAAALVGRRNEEQGIHLDLSLAQCMGAFLAPKLIERVLARGEPRILNAPAGSYETCLLYTSDAADE